MPLTDIASAKDAQQSFQPLLLVQFTFHDGTIYRASTHPLNTAEGGYQYGGSNYVGRIISQDISAVQGYDSTGIDLIPRAAITLADADKAIKTGYEDIYGFAGAAMELVFVFWDADSATFSSDNIMRLRGICDPATCDSETLTVSAVNKLNLQRRMLPSVPHQQRCPWINPTTVAQRALADDEDSIFYECGETGSLGSAPPCNYTPATCTRPNRFGGSQYLGKGVSRSRDYTSGEWINIQNNPNEARYGSPIPMVYGTAWVDPIVLPTFGDGNSTRFEAIVCLGEVQSILRVVVNDVELQPATDITGGVNYIVRDPLLRYNVLNRGDRDGAKNQDAFYDGNGDPYGSQCAILCVVPRRAAESSGVPRCRVLVQGPKLRVYADVSTYSKAFTSNPVWVLMDLLIWAGLEYADLELQTFIDAASICDATISYTDQYGATSNHARYSCSLVLRQRRSAADIIRSVRQGCGAILVPNSSSGKLQIFIEGTLASQQPSAVTGSNYVTAISSKSLAGATVSGYVAYDFTKFLLDGKKSSFKIQTQPLSNTPNRVAFGFINSERDWAGDSLSIADTDAIARSGQPVDEQYEADGINTLDQAKRIAGRRLARNLRGNGRSDSGGTEFWSWKDTFRTVRCRVGQIIRVSNAHEGISNALGRVTQMRPSTNWETVQITVQRHSDDWYVDTYSQNADPEESQQARNRLARAAFPWGPVGIAPASGDPMYDETDQTFTLAEVHETAADGTIITKLAISGKQPVNLFTGAPPTVGRQGTTASSGGTFLGSGRTYFIAVVSLDAFGAPSAPSILCQVVVTNVGTANTITVPILGWPSGAVGYIAYVGNSPQLLTEHASGGSTPSSITINSFEVRGKGMPDPEFDRMRTKIKRVVHSGVWGQPVDVVAPNAFTIDAAGWTTNEWAGYDVSILGRAAGGDLAILNYSVVSNTADTLTVTPDPDGDVVLGDAIIMRSKPTVGSNYVEDALWENTLENSGAGLAVDAEAGMILRVISGPGAGFCYPIASNTSTRIYIQGEWLPGQTPTSASRYIVEAPDWQVNITGDSLNNADLDKALPLSVEVTNYRQQVVLVQVVTLDGGQNEAIDSLCPVREIYVFGGSSPSIGNNDGYFEMVTTAGEVTPDLSDGLNQQETMDDAVFVKNAIYTGGAIAPGMRLRIKLIEDAVGGHVPTFDTEYIGLVDIEMDLRLDTYSIFKFVRNTANKWEYDGGERGLSII